MAQELRRKKQRLRGEMKGADSAKAENKCMRWIIKLSREK